MKPPAKISKCVSLVLSTLLLTFAVAGTAAAAPPDITSLTPSNSNRYNMYEPGTVVTITVAAEDPDCGGSCSSECGMAIDSTLTAWTAEGGLLFGHSDGVTASPYTASVQWEAPAVVGTYLVEVSVSDNGRACGGAETATAGITFLVNNRPNALSDMLIGENTEANPVIVTGNLLVDNGYGTDYDIDGDPLSVYGFWGYWPLPEDGSFECYTNADVNICVNRYGDVTCEFYDPYKWLSEGDIGGYEFEYWLSDGRYINQRASIDSHTGKLACLIRGVNDAPIAEDESITVAEDWPTTFALYCEDDWDDTQTYSFDCPDCKPPDHGTVSIDGSDVGRYVPDKDYAGPDSFNFEVCDNFGLCDLGLVTVTVMPRDDPPTADAGGPYEVASGEGLPLDGSGSTDPDLPHGDVIALEWDLDGDGVFDDGAGETLVLSWPEVEQLVCGGTCVTGASTQVALKVTDGTGASDITEATVTITSPNSPPTVSPLATPSTGPAPLNVQFTANAHDPDGDPLAFLWEFGDGGAASTEENPAYVYAAPGTYTATVSVSDGQEEAVGQVEVTVDSTMSFAVSSVLVRYQGRRGTGTVIVEGAGVIPEPSTSDTVALALDGITLFEKSFSEFVPGDSGGFEVRENGLKVFFDPVAGRLSAKRSKISLLDMDNNDGVEIIFSLGAENEVEQVNLVDGRGKSLVYTAPDM